MHTHLIIWHCAMVILHPATVVERVFECCAEIHCRPGIKETDNAAVRGTATSTEQVVRFGPGYKSDTHLGCVARACMTDSLFPSVHKCVCVCVEAEKSKRQRRTQERQRAGKSMK